ncbi:class I SAM-dependent methyltransferase [Paenibacillus silagei]|uniref:Methyltransferase type 11 domain-containing protein n=1 Tax=Paenibacillus silagei TaxID=1670801 RepID=A0ABS4NMC1_9BACL|nr:class I SAM-dependent methyltransferase [Paenibacillus silagei]MBP2111202.1 hypothetical protein [Paenibacillus silagei]
MISGQCGNFLALPYLDGKFDFIVSSFALHHLTSDQMLLAIQENYILFPKLIDLLEDSGCITKHLKVNQLLHVVLAVPIR